MARKSVIGSNPLDSVIPPPTADKTKLGPKKSVGKKAAEPPPARERLTVQLPAEIVERARDAAFWERTTVTDIVEQGISIVLDKLEQRRGEPFTTRSSGLKVGRPVKRR